MNILIIEDEFNLADAIKSMLKKENYIIKICTNGTEGEDEALSGIYDLILLDVMLPGKNGFEILKSIRKENINSKVIMLTAKANIDDKMEGFNEGANDYLTKPFHLDELSARIRNLTLRKFTQNDIVLKCSNLSFNTKTRKADVKDEELSLTRKETGILEYLMLNQGRPVSQEELIEHVWDSSVDNFSNSIRVHISSLRKKLRNALGYDPIHNRISEGYVMEEKKRKNFLCNGE